MNFEFLILRQCPPRSFVRGFLQGHDVGVGACWCGHTGLKFTSGCCEYAG